MFFHCIYTVSFLRRSTYSLSFRCSADDHMSPEASDARNVENIPPGPGITPFGSASVHYNVDERLEELPVVNMS